MMNNYESYRKVPGGDFDLLEIFYDICDKEGKMIREPGADFIESVLELSPIRSRQAAAIVLTYALELCK